MNNGLNIRSVLWERQIVLRWWNILHFPSLSLSMLLFSTRKTMYFRTVSRKRAISKFQYGWLTYRGSRYWSNSDTPNADTTKNPLERILLRHGKVSYYFFDTINIDSNIEVIFMRLNIVFWHIFYINVHLDYIFIFAYNLKIKINKSSKNTLKWFSLVIFGIILPYFPVL